MSPLTYTDSACKKVPKMVPVLNLNAPKLPTRCARRYTFARLTGLNRPPSCAKWRIDRRFAQNIGDPGTLHLPSRLLTPDSCFPGQPRKALFRNPRISQYFFTPFPAGTYARPQPRRRPAFSTKARNFALIIEGKKSAKGRGGAKTTNPKADYKCRHITINLCLKIAYITNTFRKPR